MRGHYSNIEGATAIPYSTTETLNRTQEGLPHKLQCPKYQLSPLLLYIIWTQPTQASFNSSPISVEPSSTQWELTRTILLRNGSLLRVVICQKCKATQRFLHYVSKHNSLCPIPRHFTSIILHYYLQNREPTCILIAFSLLFPFGKNWNVDIRAIGYISVM